MPEFMQKHGLEVYSRYVMFEITHNYFYPTC